VVEQLVVAGAGLVIVGKKPSLEPIRQEEENTEQEWALRRLALALPLEVT